MKTSAPARLDEVAQFLAQFRRGKTPSGLVVLEREKNLQGLLELEISAAERERLIDALLPEDYYKGPREDQVNLGYVIWEFGLRYRYRDVYIKLSLHPLEQYSMCLSFHPAERKIKLPYR